MGYTLLNARAVASGSSPRGGRDFVLHNYPAQRARRGTGLGHPEPPYFVPESTESVLAGEVVAIEPGLFVDGVGGMRFERNYRVHPDGFETLTRHRLTLEP